MLQVRGHTIPANTLIQPLMTEILKASSVKLFIFIFILFYPMLQDP